MNIQGLVIVTYCDSCGKTHELPYENSAVTYRSKMLPEGWEIIKPTYPIAVICDQCVYRRDISAAEEVVNS